LKSFSLKVPASRSFWTHTVQKQWRRNS